VLPLAGIRVLDFTTFLSGPLATRTLGQLGADVVKIEPPTGDSTRAGFGIDPAVPVSEFWLALHRDRRSVVLDLKTEAGRGVAHDLAAHADVLLENFSPGVTARLGIAPSAVRAVNPRLVYCSITGYGSDGPHATQVAIDGPVQAFSGALETTGRDGGFGWPIEFTAADVAGASAGAQAVLAALFRRERTGEGMHIDLSLAECLLDWLSVSDRRGTQRAPTTIVVDAGDGRPLLVQTPLHFQARLTELLAAVPGCEGLASDPRFATFDDRRAHLDEYLALARTAFASRTRAEWLDVFRTAGIPASTVQTIDQAMHDPQLAYREATTTVAVPGAGVVDVLASPFVFDGERVHDTTPPPVLGEHTDEVLREVAGYDDARIEALRAAGAFGLG
jgi:CoA:oxalate CoA-transferase